MGYDAKDKALVVNPGEARAIPAIFAEYLAVGSVRKVASRLKELGVVGKRRTDRYARVSGGAALLRGALYNILRNPIYIGKTRLKNELHDGLHEAITDNDTWARVQALLAEHGGTEISKPRRPAKRLLDGVLFDPKGRAMRTTYACKSVRQGGTARTKRYWYYTSKPTGAEDRHDIERLPATAIEGLVLSSLKNRLGDKAWLADQIVLVDGTDTPMADILQAADALNSRITADDRDTDVLSLSGLIDRIEAQRDRLCIWINLSALLVQGADENPTLASFAVPFKKRQNGCSRPIVITPEDAPNTDPDLIALVADARRWVCELLEGKSQTIQQITEREGLRSGSVSRVFPLAWLAPDITQATLEGPHPPDLTAKSLRNRPELPLSWEEQRRILGFQHH